MTKVQIDDIVIFDEKPDNYDYTQVGIVQGTGKGGDDLEYVHVGLIPRAGTKDNVAREILFFQEDEGSINGMLSWDVHGNWKIDSVWRPD